MGKESWRGVCLLRLTMRVRKGNRRMGECTQGGDIVLTVETIKWALAGHIADRMTRLTTEWQPKGFNVGEDMEQSNECVCVCAAAR